MNPIVVERQADAEGVLHLDLPLGPEGAGRNVRVSVTLLPRPLTQAQWEAWVYSTAGTWQGEFERPPQGEYEEREPLS